MPLNASRARRTDHDVRALLLAGADQVTLTLAVATPDA